MAKKSPNGISAKKSITGRIRAITIPSVMRIEISAQVISTALMTDSPGRRLTAQVGCNRQARPSGRACRCHDLVVIEVLDQPAMPSRADCVSAYWSSLSGMNFGTSAICSRFSM